LNLEDGVVYGGNWESIKKLNKKKKNYSAACGCDEIVENHDVTVFKHLNKHR